MEKIVKKIIFYSRLAWWGGAVIFLLWLFWRNLVPTGVLVLDYKKGSPNSAISDLHPKARLIDLGEQDNNQRFYVDPVYFDAKVPRAFETVTVEIDWQNQSQPILELGARKVRGEFGFVFKSLQNKFIDDLSWSCQRYGEVMFCQKKKRYEGLADFLRAPAGRVLAYRYSLPQSIKHDVMNVETKIDSYDYLVAGYVPPQSLGNGWYRQEVIFDWNDFAIWRNELGFMLSAPQLNEGHGQITVGDITVRLEREPMDWEGFKEYIRNQVRRLK